MPLSFISSLLLVSTGLWCAGALTTPRIVDRELERPFKTLAYGRPDDVHYFRECADDSMCGSDSSNLYCRYFPINLIAQGAEFEKTSDPLAGMDISVWDFPKGNRVCVPYYHTCDIGSDAVCNRRPPLPGMKGVCGAAPQHSSLGGTPTDCYYNNECHSNANCTATESCVWIERMRMNRCIPTAWGLHNNLIQSTVDRQLVELIPACDDDLDCFFKRGHMDQCKTTLWGVNREVRGDGDVDIVYDGQPLTRAQAFDDMINEVFLQNITGYSTDTHTVELRGDCGFFDPVILANPFTYLSGGNFTNCFDSGGGMQCIFSGLDYTTLPYLGTSLTIVFPTGDIPDPKTDYRKWYGFFGVATEGAGSRAPLLEPPPGSPYSAYMYKALLLEALRVRIENARQDGTKVHTCLFNEYTRSRSCAIISTVKDLSTWDDSAKAFYTDKLAVDTTWPSEVTPWMDLAQSNIIRTNSDGRSDGRRVERNDPVNYAARDLQRIPNDRRIQMGWYTGGALLADSGLYCRMDKDLAYRTCTRNANVCTHDSDCPEAGMKCIQRSHTGKAPMYTSPANVYRECKRPQECFSNDECTEGEVCINTVIDSTGVLSPYKVCTCQGTKGCGLGKVCIDNHRMRSLFGDIFFTSHSSLRNAPFDNVCMCDPSSPYSALPCGLGGSCQVWPSPPHLLPYCACLEPTGSAYDCTMASWNCNPGVGMVTEIQPVRDWLHRPVGIYTGFGQPYTCACPETVNGVEYREEGGYCKPYRDGVLCGALGAQWSPMERCICNATVRPTVNNSNTGVCESRCVLWTVDDVVSGSRANGELCGGASRGVCQPLLGAYGSKCECKAGYYGAACQHQYCPSGKSGLLCSGPDRGECHQETGRCHCLGTNVGFACEIMYQDHLAQVLPRYP